MRLKETRLGSTPLSPNRMACRRDWVHDAVGVCGLAVTAENSMLQTGPLSVSRMISKTQHA